MTTAKQKIKQIISELIRLLMITIMLFLSFVMIAIIIIGHIEPDDYSRLAERHGDYESEILNNDIDTYDKIMYNAIIFKIISSARFHKDKITSTSLYNIVAKRVFSNTTMYSFIVKYERPELYAAFIECKKLNDTNVCFAGFEEYDRLYMKDVVEIESYKSFVENEIYKNYLIAEKAKVEAEQKRIREEEENRIEANNKRTKLYSCVENGSQLICNKVNE